jgi:hypothetical protein
MIWRSKCGKGARTEAPSAQVYRLEDLIKRMTPRNVHKELDFGGPVGRGAVKSRRSYVPDRGDIVWLQFNPQAGHEQAGHRPALVLSPASYNRRSGLMLCCPVTNQRKGYPFEVVIGADADREYRTC